MEISKDQKGTHTIQSLIDVMTMDEEYELASQDLKGKVFEMGSVRLLANRRTKMLPTLYKLPSSTSMTNTRGL